VATSCRFLTTLGRTDGFDYVEAYELALHRIAAYEWSSEATKVLMFIGDAILTLPGMFSTGRAWNGARP